MLGNLNNRILDTIACTLGKSVYEIDTSIVEVYSLEEIELLLEEISTDNKVNY